MDVSGSRRVRARLQVTPVVVDGVMYVTAANAVWALDARTGRQVWHYSRPRTQGLVGDAGKRHQSRRRGARRSRVHVRPITRT